MPPKNVLIKKYENRRLYDAIDQWALCAPTTSPGARTFYDQRPAADDTHHQALRAVRRLRWMNVGMAIWAERPYQANARKRYARKR